MDGIDFGTRLDFLEQGEDARRRLAEDAFGLAALGARREVPFPKGPEPQDVFGGVGGGIFEDTTRAAWLVRRVDEVGADGLVATKWQVWSPVWVAKHTLGETSTYLPDGMASDAWNDLPSDVAAADGMAVWAALKVVVDCNDYSVKREESALIIVDGEEAGGLADTAVVPPSGGSAAGADGVYHIKVKIGEWVDEASEAEQAQGVTRLAFRQRHLGVIVESWSPRREAQETTLLTGASVTETGEGAKLTVTRAKYPIPPPTEVLEDLELTLPEGDGAIPEGTVFWGKVSVEEIRDGSTSGGGELTGYKLKQEKFVWQDGGLVEAEGSPVEIGTIPAAQGGGGTNWVVGKPTIIPDGDGVYFEVWYFGQVTETDGAPSVTWTETEAWRREVNLHSADHTPGVL